MAFSLSLPGFAAGSFRLPSSTCVRVPVFAKNNTAFPVFAKNSTAFPVFAKATTAFPAFIPPEVENLKGSAARDMAQRIQRLSVKTGLQADPIPTACVVPPNAGKEELPVLLLHGFDSSCLEWRNLYPFLPPMGIEAWALDILGWGFTDAQLASASVTVEAKREHIYEFWKTHIGRPMVVVGPSLGGAAAIDFALTHPDAVAKLVLIDAQGFAEGLGPMGSLPRVLAYAGVAVLKSTMLRTYANTLAFYDTQFATEDNMRVGRLHTLMPAWEDSMVSFMRSGGYNVADRIKEVKQDVLLIWGEEDKILDRAFAERFAAELPSVQLEWIQNCGHLPHLEKPQDVADLIREFMSKGSL